MFDPSLSGASVQSPAQKMLSNRWLIFGVLSIAYLIIIFHRLSPAVMSSDLISAFAMDGAALGLLGSMYFYPYALMQLPAGILCDAIGPGNWHPYHSVLPASVQFSSVWPPISKWPCWPAC